MSIKGGLKSLDAIKKKVADKSGGFDGESPFLTLKDGDSFVIRFLQEIGDDNDHYDERRGLMAVVQEHTSPKDYKIRAVCTMEEEGRCWACEQESLPEIGKKWKPRLRFYTNVLVRTDDGPKVKILAQGFGDSNIGQDLIAFSEEYEGLGGQDFKLTRKGSGMNDTKYQLIPKAPSPLTDEEAELEVKDLAKFVKYVSYENQADFYGGNTKADDSPSDW